MRVRATQLGYFKDRRVRPGQEFVVTDPALVSHRWMTAIDADAKAAVEAKRKAEEAAVQAALGGSKSSVQPVKAAPLAEAEQPKGKPGRKPKEQKSSGDVEVI